MKYYYVTTIKGGMGQTYETNWFMCNDFYDAFDRVASMGNAILFCKEVTIDEYNKSTRCM